MFAWLRYEFTLKSLQKEKHATEIRYQKEEADLLAKNAGMKEVQQLNERQIHEMQKIHDQIAKLQTDSLRDEAERYLLPIPNFNTGDNGAWEFSPTCAHYQLKQSPLAELRSAISKEKKERRESWQSWVALLIGLVGALIGLVAAIKK